MEPENNNRKKVLFIRTGGSQSDSIPDPELMVWLEALINQLADEVFDGVPTGVYVGKVYLGSGQANEPTEMQELEYLDSTVEGEDHPEILEMIMSAYRKNLEE